MANFNFLTNAILQYFPEWNLIPHSLADLQDFTDREKVIVKETDLIDDLGEYKVYKGQPFIFIHKFISENYKPWVFGHETGHYILHSVLSAKFSRSMKRKIELEANIFAACFFIPRKHVYSKSLAELHFELNFPKEMILFRKRLYDEHNNF